MFFQEPTIIKNALHGEFKDIVMSTFKTHMAIKGFAHGDGDREFKERDSSVRYIQRSIPQHRGIELLEKDYGLWSSVVKQNNLGRVLGTDQSKVNQISIHRISRRSIYINICLHCGRTAKLPRS